MRCMYRERRYFCGDYLEVDIFPVFCKQRGRGRKARPTSEVQTRLNEHNSEQKLIRLLNANFTGADYEIHLTYSNENMPESANGPISRVAAAFAIFLQCDTGPQA